MSNDVPQTWLTSGILPAYDGPAFKERITASIATVRAWITFKKSLRAAEQDRPAVARPMASLSTRPRP